MKYLLDTNACVALINGRPAAVRGRFQGAVADRAEIFTSPIVVFELWYGVEKSLEREANEARLSAFFAGPVETIGFDEADAHVAGTIRAHLQAAGTPIGAYYLLIAAQGLRRGLRVVTANGSEFSRVAGLDWEDWATLK